jgi:hypothetical protein
MSYEYPVDPTTLRAKGTRGVISTGAGLGLWIVNALVGIPVVGWVISGGLVFLGVMGLVGRERTDKGTGAILMGAGALGLASIFLKGLTTFLFGVGGFALVAFGVWNLVQFARGLRSRS